MTYVPQIKDLRVAYILAEARKHVNIDDYMPNMKDYKLKNRDFVVMSVKKLRNLLYVVNTLISAELYWVVEEVKSENDKKYIKKRTCEWKYFPSFWKYSQIQRSKIGCTGY